MKVRVYEDTRAAIKAGQEPRTGYVYVDVDLATLTPEERDELAKTNQDGNVRDNFGITLNLSGLATPESVKEWLQEKFAERAKREADREAIYEEFVSRLLTESQEQFNERYFSTYNDNDQRALNDPRLESRVILWAEYQVALQAAKVAQEAEQERIKNEIEAEKVRVRAAREQQITDWVAEHGTINQQGRSVAGLLDRREILDAMHEQVFAPLNLTRYQKLTDYDIECEDECYEKECKYESYPPESMSAETWDSYCVIGEQVRRIYPDAELQIREHRGWCDNCDAEIIKLAVKVIIRQGVINFTQEFEL